MSVLRPRDDLKTLEGYHSPQLDAAVRLNTNESPYPPPAEFVDAWLAEVAAVPLNRYPDRAARELRAALARLLAQPVERVFCANGSNEVLQTLLLTYGGPGRRLALFEPTYVLHAHLARITGTEVVEGRRAADFTVARPEAERLLRDERPELVLLCNPNNPTGTVEPRATVEAVSRVAPGLVVVDEAYGEFADWTALELVADDGNLVVVRTYSKIWSMAAVRLGFCVGPPDIVAELEKVVLPYHLGAPAQIAGRVALRFDVAMRDRVARLVAERGRVHATLRDRAGITVYPSGANFLLVRVHDGGHDVWRGLVERGVLVRDFSHRPGLDDCLRVSIGTPEENDVFLAAIGEVLEEVG